MADSTMQKVEEKISRTKEDRIMAQMPESIKQLRKLVKDKIIDKWEDIAIQLRFTPAQIQAIKDGHKGQPVKNCCTDMLFGWIDSKESKNPEALIAAIREIGNGFLADKLKEEMKTVDDILEQRYLQTKVIPEIASKWFEIGMVLDIPHGKLQTIKDESDFSGACCLDMLGQWFNRGKNVQESECPIWKNMYDAMYAIGLKFRAKELKDSLLLIDMPDIN